MLLRSVAVRLTSIVLGSMIWFCSSAVAHEDANLLKDLQTRAENEELVRMGGPVCQALIKMLVFPEKSYEYLFETYAEACPPKAKSGEFRIKGKWLIKTHLATSVKDSRTTFSEVEVKIIGPTDKVLNATNGKFESVIFRLIIFYDKNLDLITVPYWRSSSYNGRSFSELEKGASRKDNRLFDPQEPWTNFKQRFEKEILDVTCATFALYSSETLASC